MIKMHNKIIDTLLVSVIALGLSGCAINGNVATQTTNHTPNSAKVTNHNNHHKSSQAAATSQNKVATNQEITTQAKQEVSNNAVSNNAVSEKAATNKSTVNTINQQTPNSSTVTDNQQAINNQTTQTSIQIKQNEVAVWTDQYGIVHHVDVNGLDYQTIPGSVQTHYEQWNGQIPANAQIVENGGPNIFQKSDKYQQQIQLGLGDIAIWTDQYGIVHHVDSDGMDRQTIPGSVQIHYEDWSGVLPDNAQVIHNN